ncbi:Rv3235 family protein [Actinomadura parmotrematis]|uniref:Uncharacterized protein n=1 Tax=Actinomadura parmotrematis TaxID=2864039 RepID=A0ABS7FVU3_9ACTN|nr:Rv3235 family protein [Actinomadura parmotrematis]MBW8484551.1 hypothetical protein [Actinomadura parmotrematis]
MDPRRAAVPAVVPLPAPARPAPVRLVRAVAPSRPSPAPLRAVPPAPGGGPDPLSGEAVRDAVLAAVRLISEVVTGARPDRQLAGMALPEVRAGLAALRPPAGGRTRPPAVLRHWFQRPSPAAVEAGAVVDAGGHVHAIALRLELRRGRWCCTAVETTARRVPAPGRRLAA